MSVCACRYAVRAYPSAVLAQLRAFLVIMGDREKPGAERAAKLIMVYYVPPKRCHGGIPPWTPKQKQSSLAPGFSWSPISGALAAAT
jgi:hypothetical protein